MLVYSKSILVSAADRVRLQSLTTDRNALRSMPGAPKSFYPPATALGRALAKMGLGMVRLFAAALRLMSSRVIGNTSVRSFLLSRGVWVEKSTDDLSILSLIDLLKPKQPRRELKRIGAAIDGGYLIPDDLDGVKGCVSPGVSSKCSFDVDIADLGIDVFLADASVSALPVQHERFHFSRLFFDTFNSTETITIDDYCKIIYPDSDLILQMDIEGAEYRVINSASDYLMSRFRIIVIEFHYLSNLFSRFGFREISTVFTKIIRTHNVVHIHPNNVAVPAIRGNLSIPPYMEFTFYRKDRDVLEDRRRKYPHPLDAKNVPHWVDLPLPECWYL